MGRTILGRFDGKTRSLQALHTRRSRRAILLEQGYAPALLCLVPRCLLFVIIYNIILVYLNNVFKGPYSFPHRGSLRAIAVIAEGVSVKPGAAGLLIGIECSRVRNSLWMYLTSFVTTRICVELAAVQRKLPDWDVVGFQLYSARIFHVTLSSRIYKGGQRPPPNDDQHLRQYK